MKIDKAKLMHFLEAEVNSPATVDNIPGGCCLVKSPTKANTYHNNGDLKLYYFQ